MLAEVDFNRILEFSIVLMTSGVLGSAILFGTKAYRKLKNAWTENKSLKDKITGLVEAGGGLLDEGEVLAAQLLALSKATNDSDRALDRILANDELRKAILESSGGFSESAQKDLAQLMTPVKDGIRHYAGMNTGKLTALKESMERDLNAQETRNRIMTNSAKMAALIAKMGLKALPKLFGAKTPEGK